MTDFEPKQHSNSKQAFVHAGEYIPGGMNSPVRAAECCFGKIVEKR
ncbi:MAG: hypothetical protein H8D47_00045 [Planctomycetes bacterium]|nr:hypothetical protein [Planctomycetota bacterium]MBL7106881.1 hypothetical protein [Phycisphaerae bacterium]